MQARLIAKSGLDGPWIFKGTNQPPFVLAAIRHTVLISPAWNCKLYIYDHLRSSNPLRRESPINKFWRYGGYGLPPRTRALWTSKREWFADGGERDTCPQHCHIYHKECRWVMRLLGPPCAQSTDPPLANAIALQ